MEDKDWFEWHRAYDDESSRLHRRLELVQHEIRCALDARPDGPVRIVSLCAGQGRDVIGVLADHPRRDDVTARLVELDEQNAAVARAAAAAVGLTAVELVVTDAGLTDSYIGAVPADLVVACGVFGNMTDDDLANTIGMLPQLCAANATVIWTRHRRAPDLTPTIREWFERAEFREIAFHAPAKSSFSVGVHELTGSPTTLVPGERLFRFVAYSASTGSNVRIH